MKTYYPVSPDQAQQFGTRELRDRFLVESLFIDGSLNAVYSLEDRMLLIGATPVDKTLSAEIGSGVTGTEKLLARREMGIINIGGPGTITSAEKSYALAHRHCLYLGMGSEAPEFSSDDPKNPARFYCVSVPAHRQFPAATGVPDQAEIVSLGTKENANERQIHKFIHPDGIASCQLVMGFTVLSPGSVWNTMPPHTHLRRTEAYLYFDLPSDQIVMHFMGEGTETRHLVVRNGQAIFSPSWSIHGGAGTTSYSFVWAMAGENQDFTDMDHLPLNGLA